MTVALPLLLLTAALSGPSRGAVDIPRIDYWHILTSAIDSGGPDADDVFALLGTIDDQKARSLLETTLGGQSGPAIEYAARGLTPSECRFYLQNLKRAAIDSSIQPKSSLLTAIARAGTDQAAQVLAEVAGQASQPAAGIAFGLLEHMGSIAEPVLEREAISGETAWTRETAASALRRMGTRGALPAFKADLRDPDENVRIAGALGLAQMEIPDGRAILESAAKRSGSGYQIDALVGLAILGERKAIRKIVDILNDSGEGTRGEMVWAIARSKSAKLKALTYQMELGRKPEFRAMFAEKLLDPTDPQDMKMPKEMLTDCHQIGGLIAAQKLLGAGFHELSENAITCGLSSPDEQVRHMAMDLAAQDSELWPTLASKVGDSDPAMQVAALTAIRNLGQKEKFNDVEPNLESQTRAVSLAAAKALAALNPTEAQRVFEQALTSRVSFVRIYSAAMLLTIEHRSQERGEAH